MEGCGLVEQAPARGGGEEAPWGEELVKVDKNKTHLVHGEGTKNV